MSLVISAFSLNPNIYGGSLVGKSLIDNIVALYYMLLGK